MIQLTTTTDQTLQPGQALTFNQVLMKTGCSECFNNLLPSSVRLSSRGAKPIYDVKFSGNVTSATNGDALQLSIAIAGTALSYGAMNVPNATAGSAYNVARSTYIPVCCCDSDLDRVSIVNSGTDPVVVIAGSTLQIGRKS